MSFKSNIQKRGGKVYNAAHCRVVFLTDPTHPCRLVFRHFRVGRCARSSGRGLPILAKQPNLERAHGALVERQS
jgi:hypothetical protein